MMLIVFGQPQMSIAQPDLGCRLTIIAGECYVRIVGFSIWMGKIKNTIHE